MNDKFINSKAYEWDIACDGKCWNRVHNYEHHTFTNIVGKDRDLATVYCAYRTTLNGALKIVAVFNLY